MDHQKGKMMEMGKGKIQKAGLRPLKPSGISLHDERVNEPHTKSSGSLKALPAGKKSLVASHDAGGEKGEKILRTHSLTAHSPVTFHGHDQKQRVMGSRHFQEILNSDSSAEGQTHEVSSAEDDELGPAGALLAEVISWLIKLEKVYLKKQGRQDFDLCRSHLKESLRFLKEMLKRQQEEASKAVLMAEYEKERAEIARCSEEQCQKDCYEKIEATKVKAKAIMTEMMERFKAETSARKACEQTVQDQQAELEKLRAQLRVSSAIESESELNELKKKTQELSDQNSQLARKAQAAEMTRKELQKKIDAEGALGAEMGDIEQLTEDSRKLVVNLERRMKILQKTSEHYRAMLDGLWEDYQARRLELQRSNQKKRALGLELKAKEQRLKEVQKRVLLLGGDTLPEEDEDEDDCSNSLSPRSRQVLSAIFLEWYAEHFQEEIRKIQADFAQAKVERYSKEQMQCPTLIYLFWDNTEPDFWETGSDDSFYSALNGSFQDMTIPLHRRGSFLSTSKLKAGTMQSMSEAKGFQLSPVRGELRDEALPEFPAENGLQIVPQVVFGRGRTWPELPAEENETSLGSWEEVQLRMRLHRKETMVSCHRASASFIVKSRSVSDYEDKHLGLKRFNSYRNTQATQSLLCTNSKSEHHSMDNSGNFPRSPIVSDGAKRRFTNAATAEQGVRMPEAEVKKFAKRQSLPLAAEEVLALSIHTQQANVQETALSPTSSTASKGQRSFKRPQKVAPGNLKHKRALSDSPKLQENKVLNGFAQIEMPNQFKNIETQGPAKISHRKMTRDEAASKLVSFYSKVNPEKVSQIDEILDTYDGQFEKMLDDLSLKYHNKSPEINRLLIQMKHKDMFEKPARKMSLPGIDLDEEKKRETRKAGHNRNRTWFGRISTLFSAEEGKSDNLCSSESPIEKLEWPVLREWQHSPGPSNEWQLEPVASRLSESSPMRTNISENLMPQHLSQPFLSPSQSSPIGDSLLKKIQETEDKIAAISKLSKAENDQQQQPVSLERNSS